MPRTRSAPLYSGRYHSGVLNGALAADAATAGRFWLVNHLASGLMLAVMKVDVTVQSPAATSTAITRITAERMSTTTDPTGTQGTPATRDSADALPSGVSVRTASTGMTISSGAVLGAALISLAVGTPTNVYASADRFPVLNDVDMGGYEFRPGEGLVIRQADAGDVDQRFTVDVDFIVYQGTGSY